MLRQPSQSSAVSLADDGDLGVDEGHQRHAVFLVLVVVVVVVARVGGKPATKSRRLSCTCGAARPDALVLLHRLEHVVDELLDARRLDVGGLQRFRARARSTGCPMRATFRIDMARSIS